MHYKHGQTAGKQTTREYRAWTAMKSRCLNPNHDKFKYYGGRGIRVCKRWLRCFENFLIDMGPCPEGLTLDRIDNDRHYMPDNCRWATISEQMRNRRPYENQKSRLELSGQRFGRLVVIGLAEIRNIGVRRQTTFWSCICDCGTLRVIQGTSLNSGLTKSCGCLRREKSSQRAKERGLKEHYPHGPNGRFLPRH